MEEINKIPPVTRALIFATLAVTLPALLKIVNPYVFLLWWKAVVGKGQIWRPITAFFYGGSGIQLLFDIFLLLRNSTDLETNKFYRKTSDYAWSLMIICTFILATNYPLQSPVLFNPLLMAIVYLWARSNEHASVSLFGLINCPARYLPYAYLLFDLLRGGMPLAMQSATGLLSAHIYYFLKDVLPATNGGRGPNYLPNTPAFLRRLLPDSPDPNTRGQEAQPEGSVRSTSWGGTAFAPAGRSFGERQTTATSSQGQRLGSSGGSGGGIRSWFGGSGGGGGSSGSTTSRSSHQNTNGRPGQARPDREAMLAAAEARLQSLRANSIAGRNQAASAAASQAANSSEARARAASATQRAGNTLSGTQDSRTSSRSPLNQEGSQAIRRTAAGSGGNTNTPFSFGSANNSGEEQETASGSGGRVAEIRRAAPNNKDNQEESEEKVEHGWGSGQRLGN